MDANTQLATRMEGQLSELSYLSDTELFAELKRAIDMTARGIALAARVWAEMDRRGLDLKEYKKSLHSYLPLVAERKLLPEAVVIWMGDAHRLRLFSTIPLEEQGRIIKSGEIPVYDNKLNRVRSVKLEELDVDQTELAIDAKNGRLRTPEQQQVRIAARKSNGEAKENPGPQMMHLAVERDIGAQIFHAAMKRKQSISGYLRSSLQENLKFDLSQPSPEGK